MAVRTALLPLAAAGLAFSIVYVISKVIYNLYFHPLAKFPGPKRAAISNLFYARHWAGGRWAYVLEDLHNKYGPVVRYAPDDLDFATAQSYQDIHGHIKQGKQTFTKGHFYTSAEASNSIVAEKDPTKHRELRKNLSHAFSAKALRTQTDVVLHYVEMWIAQMKNRADTPEGINVEEWYNWVTFDIIGDLAFGESFGSVANAKGHPSIKTIKDSLHAGLFNDLFRRVPVLKVFESYVRPNYLMEGRKKHFQFSRDRVMRRMEMGNDREDFFGHLLSEKANNLTPQFLTAQANTLILAGSETTATFLDGVTYYLLKTPSSLHHLTQEVRSAFSSPSEINGDTTQKLPYLSAVIEECLRIFPPVPAGLHRISPGATVDSHYVPKGTTVSTSFWTISHSSQYFLNPREFHPERWLPQDHPLYDTAYEGDVKGASRPFLLGPRACLGINLAYLEMRIILSRLVWEFEWELVGKGVEWERDLVLRLLWQKPELWVRFKPVER